MQFMLVVTLLIAGLTQAERNQGAAPGSSQENRTQVLSQLGSERIVKEVRHQLVFFNYDGIFDNLAYRVSSVLSLYGLRAVPPIHIIVNQGNITLEGVVAKQMDKQVAEMQAKSLPNVFWVTDNLRVEE
jgi:hypothetical protein